MVFEWFSKFPEPLSGNAGWPWTIESEQLLGRMRDKNSLPKITIVTPSYNQGQFIEETIRSVLLQGYKNLEYIIMDGGSNDGSVEIIKKYEPWITYWISERDNGQANAINKGYKIATGEILGWLNSDDILESGALFEVAKKWTEDNHPNMIYGDAKVVDEKGAMLSIKHISNLSLDYLLSVKHLPQPAVFISSSFQKHLGDIREQYKYALDFEYFLRAYLLSGGDRISSTSKILASSREYEGTKSSENHDKWAEERKVALTEIFESKLGQKVTLEQRRRAFAFILLRRSRSRAANQEKIQAIVDLLRVYRMDSTVIPFVRLIKDLVKVVVRS